MCGRILWTLAQYADVSYGPEPNVRTSFMDLSPMCGRLLWTFAQCADVFYGPVPNAQLSSNNVTNECDL